MYIGKCVGESIYGYRGEQLKSLIIFSSLFSFSIILIAFIYSESKNNKHKELCNDFLEQYHYIPADILAYQSSGVLFTFQKDIFFLMAAIFNDDSFFVRNLDKNIYSFINNQPSQKTHWIKIKFLLLALGFLSLIANYLVFTIFIK